MATDAPLEAVVPLDQRHDVSGFDCGQLALNDYLHKYALTNQQNRSGRTYVVTRGAGVVGFEASPSHESHLFLLMKDIEAIARR